MSLPPNQVHKRWVYMHNKAIIMVSINILNRLTNLAITWCWHHLLRTDSITNTITIMILNSIKLNKNQTNYKSLHNIRNNSNCILIDIAITTNIAIFSSLNLLQHPQPLVVSLLKILSSLIKIYKVDTLCNNNNIIGII